MAENEKKPVVALLPAILTGAAALIAALTTVYVNVRNDLKEGPVPATMTAAVPAASRAVAAPVQAGPQQLQLQLRRMAVQEDGAVGSADWRFSVEADGQPLFAFGQDSLTSEGGRNIVVLDQDSDSRAGLELAPGKPIQITIKGWRGGWLRKSDEPLVSGEGWLSSAGALPPITVQAPDKSKGAFTFYFTATAGTDRDAQ